MSDVSELIGRLRGPIKHPQQSVSLRLEAADALETLEHETEELKEELDLVSKQREDYFSQYSQKLTEYTEMKIALAKLAPVVEAARWYFKTMQDGKLSHEREEAADSLFHALATMEAAHD